MTIRMRPRRLLTIVGVVAYLLVTVAVVPELSEEVTAPSR
jgi:hypothetical protein